MGRLSIFIFLLLSLAYFAGALAVSSEDPERRLLSVIRQLEKLPTGVHLLEKARRLWGFSQNEALSKVIQWSQVSRTDAVLTRHFDPQTGQETREREVVIYLKRSQAYEDLVLDLSHELLHATTRPSWDPYDPRLTPGKYIWAAIEGDGGEVQAMAAECQVALEWEASGKKDGLPKRTLDRCHQFALSGLQMDLEKIKDAFYRVGKWRTALRDKLSNETRMFPKLSEARPQLYSSTGNAPYPMALYREYEGLTQIACENSKRRMSALQKELRRSVASDPEKEVSEFLSNRCSQ